MDFGSICPKRHHSCVGTSTAMEEGKVKRQGIRQSVVIIDDESGICSSTGTASTRQQVHWVKCEGSEAVGQRRRFLCAMSLQHLLFVTAAATTLTLSSFATPIAAQSFQVRLLPANNTPNFQLMADIAFSPVAGSSPPTYQFCFRVKDWTSPEPVTKITLRYGQIQQYIIRKVGNIQIEASSPSVTDNQLEACNASVSELMYTQVQEQIEQGNIFAVVHIGDNNQDYVLGLLMAVDEVPPFPPVSSPPAGVPSEPMSTPVPIGLSQVSPDPLGTSTQRAAASAGNAAAGTEKSSALSWAQGAHTWSLGLAAVLLSLSVTGAAA
eukprot:TRINITY_DN5510_c0_g3_i1.p1 TRINITY_DN5510_c0_g3~~TRINITY_DN5510_c0_g3_i1.p1  ORF type:complete len:323 (+),score=29.85 TRINITY_DN5510_c0_g3_i1:73-1041(+)